MTEDFSKNIMFINYEGFSRIIWNLESEIVVLWTNGQLESAYERIKQLYIHVASHLDKKKIKDFKDVNGFLEDFAKIEKIIYDPVNRRVTTMAKYKKETNRKDANKLMTSVYMEIKQHMKESGLEAFYGVSQQDIIDSKKRKNIKNVFGQDMG